MTPTTEATTLPLLLRAAAQAWPDRTAASFPGETVTFGGLWAGASRMAAALAAQGVAPGEHVGLLMPNSIRLLETFFGLSLIGAIPVPLNTRYRADELPYAVEHADLVGIVSLAESTRSNAGEVIDYVARLAEALPGLRSQPAGRIALPEAPRLRFVMALGDRDEGWITSLPAKMPGDDDWPLSRLQAARPQDAATLLYTSGTTSRPKGVMLTHRALMASALGASVERLGLGRDDVIWNPAPMCHVSAFVTLLGVLMTGAEYLSASHFDPEITCEHLAARRATIAFANFPAFYFGLDPVMTRKNLPLDSLRIVTVAAAPPEVERIRGIFPSALQLSVTGSTELSGTICVNTPDDTPAQRAETAGPPIRGVEVSIRNPETLERLPAGAIGEIWVRGTCLLDRYYRDPASPLTGAPDPGWFWTADLGTLDDGGRLAFRGRLKDMLKVGGENVSAAEIETFLLRHPAVSVAQVVAAPDQRLGEVPAAFIELAPGRTASAEEIIAYCRSGIAAYKVPRIVRFVTEWPTSTTKIQKDRLRAML